MVLAAWMIQKKVSWQWACKHKHQKTPRTAGSWMPTNKIGPAGDITINKIQEGVIVWDASFVTF